MPKTTTDTKPASIIPRTLTAIDADFLALYQLLEERGGDVTDAGVDEAITRWMGENLAAAGKKLDGYCKIIDDLKARGTAQKLAAQHLQDQARFCANAADRLRERLREFMERNNLSELRGEIHKAKLATASGQDPLEIDAESEIPSQFMIVTLVPRKDAIREALERGETVPGCRLGERKRSLRLT